MTTVSDALAESTVAAVPRGRSAADPDTSTGVRAPDARARAASVTVTPRSRKTRVRRVARIWVLTDAPPSLRDVIENRVPGVDQVPAGNGPMRLVWVVWNHLIAVPATAVLYAVAWVLQHPARAGAAALVAVPITLMWINK